MKRMLETVALAIVLVYVGMGIFLYVSQRKLLYFPTPDKETVYAHMTMRNDGESIRVIVLNKGNDDAILYFGGNAESMVRSADEIAKEFPKHTVYLLEYRGYGRSTGEATEAALYQDALKLYDTIKPMHKHIFVSGRSLGTGIATYLAAHREVSKLVLITPFDTIVNIAQQHYPIYPVFLMLKDKYDSLKSARDIKAKTLILVAKNDKIIPLSNTQRLIDVFNKKRIKVVTINNRGHSDISVDDMYYPTIRNFLTREQ